MSWKGFKRGWNELMHPAYRRDLTPEQHKRNSDYTTRNYGIFAFFSRVDPSSIPRADDRNSAGAHDTDAPSPPANDRPGSPPDP